MNKLVGVAVLNVVPSVGLGVGKAVRAGVGAGVETGVGHASSKQGSSSAGLNAPCSSHCAGGAAMPWLQIQSKERDVVPLPHDTEHGDHAFGL